MQLSGELSYRGPPAVPRAYRQGGPAETEVSLFSRESGGRIIEHYLSHKSIIVLYRLHPLRFELKAEGLMAKCHA